MSPYKYKIAIIGAGPAGCTLARLLLRSDANVQITIFEGETALHSRMQGGTLDLHPESGMEALKRCGLFEEFTKLARFDGEAFTVCDKKLNKYISLGGTKDAKSTRGRPEIDRIQLRRILVDSLPEEMIRWGHHLNSVDSLEDGSFSLHFNTGIENGFDLVVGADGAWSHVRSVLTDIKPEYTGISGVVFSITDPEERCPDLYALTNRGSIFSFSNSKTIMAQQMSDGSLSLSTWGVHSEDYVKELLKETDGDEEAMRRILLEEYDGWAPQLRKYIEMSNGPQILRNLYQLPIGTRWKNRAGITILGDASHLMSPFAGEGVNLAMTDSMHLATAIIQAAKVGMTEALTKEIKVFEEDMFVRATKFQCMTRDMMGHMFFTPGAPESSIERYIISAAGHDMNLFLRPVFVAGVYVYFWFWRLFH
ncbi:FAD/NAD(P)-binding domain-containing protein [Tothia fuscella]|uniref:FAD/NAD(P)-binding domain-containing protein n=1 Tax=Tothia fuscella TaxID=1048955 RepID=A0A9P4TWW8_9PEZI|nr:FAD/NAD(P)-binding domain-containing protein [Tothia fuscella]